MEQPETLYAGGPEGYVAYQVLGEGPLDLLVATPWAWNIEVMWEEPRIERFFRRLASFSRVIVFDKRGTGISDPVPLGALPTLEEWTDDIRVVLDAAGSERAAIIGISESSTMAMLFAASHPERTSSLIVVNGYPHGRREPDYPHGAPPDIVEAGTRFIRQWAGRPEWLAYFAPSELGDERFARWMAKFIRLSNAPSVLDRTFLAGVDWDVRAVLPTISAPTLIIHRAENLYLVAGHGRYIAERIPGARYVELPGADHWFFAGDQDGILDEMQGFLTGVRGEADVDRVLATVLFTDLVASTERAAELGDRRWRAVLDGHDQIAAKQVAHFRGRLVKTTGDGVLATFDGPARAIRCARSVADEMRGSFGVDVRAGLHTGEVERRGEDIGGIGVHIAARVMAEAGGSEVIVSSTVKDLVVGSGLEFDDRGSHVLKGVPGEWRLYQVKA